MHQSIGKGSQPVQGSQGGHPPSTQVSMDHNYTLPTIAPASSGTTRPSLIQGIVPLFTSWASILFDTGVSHSFILLALVSSLGLKIEFLDIELHVSNLVGGVVCLNQVCRGCLLSIADW